MNTNKSQTTVIELMDQILKYVAFLSALISALTFGLQYRWLSYIFVLVFCITFTVWLIRMARERKHSGIIGPGGKPTKGVFVYSKVKRSLILTGVVIINFVSYSWLIFQVKNEINELKIPNLLGDSGPCPENMVYIPEGKFWMGAADHDPDAKDNEKPKRLIYLRAFCVDITEVSNQQYAEFVNETGHTPPPVAQPAQDDSWNGNTYPEDYANYPVVRVSWFDARDYCNWLGYQLPSEAQWEKVARGEAELVYPWGNDWEVLLANSARAELKGVSPVNSFPDGKSPYGVLNLAGNVAEWVNDWYLPNWYENMPENNPLGPPGNASQTKVIRGGSFWDGPQGLRTSARNGTVQPDASPLLNKNFIGFRCVCESCIKDANQ